MGDEEVVRKNTGLYTHLRNAGFKDFEFLSESTPDTSRRFSPESNKPQMQDKPIYDENKKMDYETYIKVLLNSNLMFSDDVRFVEDFAVCLRPEPVLSSILTQPFWSACVSVILDTLAISSVCCCAMVFGALRITPRMLFTCHVVPISWQCIKYVYITYNEFERRKILKKFVESMKNLTTLVHKSVRLLKRLKPQLSMIIISAMKLNARSRSAENQLVDHFREIVFSSIKSIILELKKTIIFLTEDFPLKAPVNAVNYNLAFLSESELHCERKTSFVSTDHLQKMKYMFILLQSEFLRQLCLCFTTSLWTRDCYKSISEVFQRLEDFNSKCARFYINLKSTFDVHYLHKRLPEENRRNNDSYWLYAEAYIKLCSVSSNLRSVLRESCSLEEYLENSKISKNVSNDVVNFLTRQSDEIIERYAQCALVVEDFRKCITRLRPKQLVRLKPTTTMIEDLATTNQTNILLGVTDFSPNCPDEVFIGISESKQMDESETDVTDVVTQRCSKLLLNELKIALQDKAKEWKEREQAALQRRNEAYPETEVLIDFKNNDDELPRREGKKCVNIKPRDIPFSSISVTESSLAKQIAAASASWKLQEEEFFDHEQDEDI